MKTFFEVYAEYKEVLAFLNKYSNLPEEMEQSYLKNFIKSVRCIDKPGEDVFFAVAYKKGAGLLCFSIIKKHFFDKGESPRALLRLSPELIWGSKYQG